MTLDYEAPPFPAVLDRDEAVRCYREGVTAHADGREFHESPYPHSGDKTCSEEDYERGYHWRRGWNDAALLDREVRMTKARSLLEER